MSIFRRSRRSSVSSNTDARSSTSSEDSERSLSETLHIEELLSHLICDENGNIFHDELLSILSARYVREMINIIKVIRVKDDSDNTI